jgi:acyl-CoA synthetase (AMP-forming)/AMP-acid ligase II
MIRTEKIAPIGELVRRHAEERPDKLAFEDAHGSVTYGGLERATAKLAAHLQAQGMEIGDRVAILLPNSVTWVLACLAIARAGGVSVPISYEATEAEVRYRM